MNNKWYRTEAKTEGVHEPMIDWYLASSEQDAKNQWNADARRYGVPIRKTVVEIREATAEETAICDKCSA